MCHTEKTTSANTWRIVGFSIHLSITIISVIYSSTITGHIDSSGIATAVNWSFLERTQQDTVFSYPSQRCIIDPGFALRYCSVLLRDSISPSSFDLGTNFAATSDLVSLIVSNGCPVTYDDQQDRRTYNILGKLPVHSPSPLHRPSSFILARALYRPLLLLSMAIRQHFTVKVHAARPAKNRRTKSSRIAPPWTLYFQHWLCVVGIGV